MAALLLAGPAAVAVHEGAPASEADFRRAVLAAIHRGADLADDVLAPDPGAPAADILGAALVTDGDTLRIGTERIRLFGIDAPETSQRCGAWDCGSAATARLKQLVGTGAVRCTLRDRDRYGRLVSTCTAGGVDLGDRLVSEGLARAYTRYGDDYAAAETRARTRKLGLWRGPAQAPWDYRAAARAEISAAAVTTEPVITGAAATSPDGPAFARAAARTDAGKTRAHADVALKPAASTPPSPGCRIKGNVSAAGERVYHLPGGRSYDRTRIDPRHGEAWFCDEAAALAAGFRPVRTR